MYINPLQNIKNQFCQSLRHSLLLHQIRHWTLRTKTRCVTFGNPANLPMDYTWLWIMLQVSDVKQRATGFVSWSAVNLQAAVNLTYCDGERRRTHSRQDSETIEHLGIDLQSLARRAFPELRGGKEFDHLLKGQFFQTPLPKWQRKLGAPKPEETFQGFYDRARMLEIHELQYATSANARKDRKSTPTTTDQKDDQKKNYQQGKK